MRVDVDLKGLSKAIKDISKFDVAKRDRVRDTVNEAALNIQKGAKKRCPVDTGRLRSSIAIEPYNDGMTMQVGTKVNYAASVEFGSGQRIIKPKRKKALYWPGAEHPVRQVKHPGTKPKPFLFPAWESEKPKFKIALREALK